MEADYRFSRTEKLKQKRLFDALFSGAKRSFAHPLLAIWKPMTLPEKIPVQIGFSVPKKSFKRASDRNTIKRKLRESYRLQKAILTDQLREQNTQIAMLIVVQKSDNTSYEVLQQKMMLLLREVADKTKHVE